MMMMMMEVRAVGTRGRVITALMTMMYNPI
jgi:hypothetical protein